MKPEHRWRRSGNGYKPKNGKNSSKIWNAIQKYGWDNVEHKILYEGLTKEEACQKEIELIALYQSTDDRFGYNISFGGDSSTLSEETRKKISDSRKGNNYGMVGENAPFYDHHHSDAAKEKIRVAFLGENNHMYGKSHTDDSKMKNFISHLSECKPVEQYDKAHNLIATYISVHEASRITGIRRCCIIDTLRGRQRTAGGYIWESADISGKELFEICDINTISYAM